MQQTNFTGWQQTGTVTNVTAPATPIVTARDLALLALAPGDVVCVSVMLKATNNASGASNLQLKIILPNTTTDTIVELEQPDADSFEMGAYFSFGYNGATFLDLAGIKWRRGADDSNVQPLWIPSMNGQAIGTIGLELTDSQDDTDVTILSYAITRVRPGLT